MNITKRTLVVAAALLAALSFAAPQDMSGGAMKGQDMNHSMQNMHQPMMEVKAMTGVFKGAEVHQGHASLFMKDGRWRLKVSDDFVIPASPAPSWQIVDAKGRVYLLNQFRIAGGRTNREIVLPKHITSVAKVQVWCSFAEVVLGEASFGKAVTLKQPV